jgi:acetylornithine/succinyldiaminopimelate/putrescine aminotransferase
VGEHLLTRLRSLRLAEIREVRGRGLLLAIHLRHRAQATVGQLRARGILVAPGRGDVIRLNPPLVLDRRHADLFVEVLAAALLALRRRGLAAGVSADMELSGVPVQRGRVPERRG